ncbi:MAG: ThuA domain-containing protein [Saprospiraceae bacterium]
MKQHFSIYLFYISLISCIMACSGNAITDEPEEKKLNVLLFSKSRAYRHASIEPGGEAMKTFFETRGVTVTQSEDSSLFTDNNLSPFDVIVFFNTTGNILDSSQQDQLVKHVRSGKGFVGIHSAADTEYDWPWYAGLLGAQFAGHPDIQQATIVKQDTQHLACKHLPDRWMRTDEWYNFRQVPDSVNVLLSIDETTYQGGAHGVDHPMAWYHHYDGGRSFYTALGHTVESYQDTLFLRHLLEGVIWAGKAK